MSLSALFSVIPFERRFNSFKARSFRHKLELSEKMSTIYTSNVQIMSKSAKIEYYIKKELYSSYALTGYINERN